MDAQPAAGQALTGEALTIFGDGSTSRDFVYIEHSAGGLYLDDDKDFQLFVDSWDRLRGAALERQETRQFLLGLADTYRAQMNA